MIKDFKPRLYQQTIFSQATAKNTLVVLPTGMGKTNVFLMIAAHRLTLYPNSKILLVGPTKPLIDQYLQVFEKHFEIDRDKMAVFTGLVKPAKRQELWKTAQVIFSTPQGLENDIISKRISLEDVSLLGIDEAHRGVGDYAYVWLAQQYHKRAKYERITALTASPGSDLEKIQEVCQNLHIEHIEVRTDQDPDVKPYIQEVDIRWVEVKLPEEFKEIQSLIKRIIDDRVKKLRDWGILQKTDLRFVNKTDLLRLQAELRGRAAQGERDYTIWNAISVLAEIMKIQHGLELLETQGIVSLNTYFEKMLKDAKSKKTKAITNLTADMFFRTALVKTQKLFEQKIEHPKMTTIKKVVARELDASSDMKIIVFNQYRDNATNIVSNLNQIPGINAHLFVGQLKKGDTGLSQKQQKEVLDKFRSNEFNVLVATSIGEEGLDIPQVDLVMFYEPIPSAIRTIQRRGRTGRQEKGRVIMLMAQDTRDVGYKWSAHHKEKRMYRVLDSLKKKINITKQPKEESITKYIKQDSLKIIVDHREKGSPVTKELIELGADIELQQLNTADYLLSQRVGVEYKKADDFVNSLIDGRLLHQLKDLKKAFERPVVLIEGHQDIYGVRNVHPNSIRGMLSTIAISYKIPILFTRDAKESASFIHIIAKREQDELGSDFSLHGQKREMTEREWQEFIISSLPGVGPALAKPLLRHFKSIKAIINASLIELQEVEKIGPVKARKIKRIIDAIYKT